MGAHRMPLPHLDDVLGLARLERFAWPARSAALRASGVPLNEGDTPPAGGAGEAGQQGTTHGTPPTAGTAPAAGGPPPAPATGAPPAPPAPPAGGLTPPPPVPTPAPEGPDADLLRDADKPDAVRNALQGLRGELKEERDARKALELRLEVKDLSTELGVPETVIHGNTPDARRASAQTFLDAVKTATENAQAATAGQSGGARPRPAPQDLDAQIVAAQQKGDWDAVTRLNAQKLAAAAAKTTP